ncbi:hypothetical protein GCM10022224_086810 [Nonomuraea antimicrobica]|uniref:Uncharacterized protein n=1 Tax=Nonomuraea antimicrobica TaxID=561173 RepID=A0ABP7DR13_9ACTN
MHQPRASPVDGEANHDTTFCQSDKNPLIMVLRLHAGTVGFLWWSTKQKTCG